MIVRDITDEDIPELIFLCIDFHKEGSFGGCDFVMREASDFFYSIIDDEDDQFFGKVVDVDGSIEGILCGQVQKYFFNAMKIGMDELFYVVKSKRNGGHCRLLLRHFENWLKTKGCKRVQLMHSSGINECKIVEFYKKLGYYHIGTLMEKDL